MNTHKFAILAALALTGFGCAEMDDQNFDIGADDEANPNMVRGYEYAPEIAANADLLIGEINVLPGIESFYFREHHWPYVEIVDEETAFVTGSATEVIENADEGDVLFGQDWVARITYIERGSHGWYVGLAPFDLMDIAYGDFEIDIGEAISRGLGKEYGMWTVERGWLPVEEWPQVKDAPRLREPEISLEHVTARQEICSGSNPTTCQFFPTLNVAASFEPSGTGSKMEVGGSLKLPIDFDAGVHIKHNTWLTPNVEYPDGYRCANGDDDCLDHMKFYAAPRIELDLEGSFAIQARLDLFKEEKEIRRFNLPGVPTVAGISIVPVLVVKGFGKVNVNQRVQIKGKLGIDGRFPAGFEYVRNVEAGRVACGGGAGCQPGYNAIPNARPRHNVSVSATPQLDLRVDVATLKGEVGVEGSVKLGLAPTVPLVVIEGPEAAVEFGLSANYTPVTHEINGGGPCLTFALKATPKVGFEGAVRVKGIRRTLFSLGKYEVEIGSMEFGKIDFPNACVADLTPRRSVMLRVIGANEPDGARDLDGFEIDSVWIERQGRSPIYPTNSGANPNSSGAPDAACGTSLMSTVDVIADGARRTWEFGVDLQSGDKVHVVRINDDQGGSCKMSGTAEVNVVNTSGGTTVLGLVNDAGGIYNVP